MKLKAKKTGRKIDDPKPVFDADFLAKVEQLARGYPHKEFIAAAFNRDLRTWHQWEQDCPAIRVAVAKGWADPVRTVAQVCFEMAASGQYPDMTRYFLDRFGKAQEIAGQVFHVEQKPHDDSEYQTLVQTISKVLDNCRDVTPTAPKLLDGKK